MSINSADKKPEKYVGPDGKAKIRMVPVDKEVIKTEGGMKRIATNQSDKNADPKDKGLKTFKKLRASYESFKPHMMYDPKTGKGYKADKEAEHLKMKKMGYTHDKPEVKEVSEAEDPKMYCKDCGCEAGNADPDCMCENDCNNLKPNQLTADRSSCGSVTKENVDEVLDTPGAMDRYHNKAKAQSDRARNSATAKLVRGTKDISKEKNTIRKREKGMDMSTKVRAKQFRKAVTGKPYGEAVETTIPDGQTALTKKDPIKKNDMDKLSAIRKMLDKERNK